MSNFDSKDFKILIVDDVPQNIQVLGNILHKEDYPVSFATNGRQALSMAESAGFDLILLDIMMPEMNGYEVCERLKENEDTRDVPVMFLTAKTDTESVVRGFEAGGVDYVTKPFNSAELLARVKTHLDLRRAQEDLREALAAKDKFFSIIAHDLKNPFTVLIGFCELLLVNVENYTPEKIKKISQQLYGSTKNALNLLENLLEWSRSQTGRIEMNQVKLDAEKIVNENMELLSVSAKKKNINLNSEVKEALYVFADMNMLSAVLRNLISNAVKFTADGGEVKITSSDTGGKIEITVSDTGTGLTKEDIEKLFRIDVHHSTKGTAGERGTGLGLILCREFIEKNGGAITVESEVGKGSSFIFTLAKPD